MKKFIFLAILVFSFAFIGRSALAWTYPTSLLQYFTFDNPSLTSQGIGLESISGNNLTIVGGLSSVAGQFSNGVKMTTGTATYGYNTMSYSSTNQPFSFNFWYKNNGASGQHTLFTEFIVGGNNAYPAIRALADSQKLKFQYYPTQTYNQGTYAETNSTTTLEDGNWHMITLTGQWGSMTSSFKMYVDKVSLPYGWYDQTSYENTNFNANFNAFYLGNQNSTALNLADSEDDFSQWKLQLAQTDINGLYTGAVNSPMNLPFSIVTPLNGSTVSAYDRTISVSGKCDVAGFHELSIQTSLSLPPVAPLCDCLIGYYACAYFVPNWGSNTVCVLDKNNPSTDNACSTFTLQPNATYSAPTSTPYLIASRYLWDSSGGFTIDGTPDFNYYSGGSWGSYGTSTLPFEIFVNSVLSTDATTRLQVYEVATTTYPYNIINTLDDNTLNNITGWDYTSTQSSAKIYTSDYTATSTRNFMVRLKDNASGKIWDTRAFTVSLYNSLGTPAPSGTEGNKLFQKTKNILKTKLLFAQFFAFYDALNAVQTSTSTPAGMIFYMNMPSAISGQYQQVEAIDFATSTAVAIATGLRPYAQAGLWLMFAFYVFSRAKSLFGPTEEEE